MLMSFAVNMPRYFVEHFLGSRELGIFSALAYLTIAGSVIVNSLSEATVPRFAKYFALGYMQVANRLLLQLVLVTLVLGIAGVVGAAFIGNNVLKIVYRAEYANQTGLFILLMAAAALGNLSSIFNYVLLAGRQFGMHLMCLLVLTVTMAAACFFAVPRWGAMGAAIGCLVGCGSQLLISVLVLWRYMRSMKEEPFGSLVARETFITVQ
jgi:O-antigen/teichoic acid export membrane protein